MRAFFLCMDVASEGYVAYDWNMKYYFILLLFLSFTSQAEVYRSVDAAGNVMFSDVEDDNSEKVTIDIAPSYTAPNIPVVDIEQDKPSDEAVSLTVPKYKLSIISPAQNETFQNPENIAVTASITPKLNATRADKLVFKLDGKQVGEEQIPLNTVLTGVERGSHILVVSVVDQSGKVLKSSKSTLFHVQRHSIAR